MKVSNDFMRQSERDFPRGSIRNGIIDGTKIQSSERRGNLLRLLCISYTTEGMNSLHDDVWERIIDEDNGTTINLRHPWRHFLKMYLSFEEWLHDNNPIPEVDRSRPVIVHLPRELKLLFPRNGNCYKIPKFHAMSKFTSYIQLFGSGIIFYGGPGKSHHKSFVKVPGQQTQRRIGEFAMQVAERFYENLIFSTASSYNDCSNKKNDLNDDNDELLYHDKYLSDDEKSENDSYMLSGGYNLRIDICVDVHSVFWNNDNDKK